MSEKYAVQGRTGRIYFEADNFQECHRWINEEYPSFIESGKQGRMKTVDKVLPEQMKVVKLKP